MINAILVASALAFHPGRGADRQHIDLQHIDRPRAGRARPASWAGRRHGRHSPPDAPTRPSERIDLLLESQPGDPALLINLAAAHTCRAVTTRPRPPPTDVPP